MIRQLIVSYVLLVAVALTAFTVPVAFHADRPISGATPSSRCGARRGRWRCC
ncbi:hypothetical protein ACRAWF_30965 [Streptomyces sp. L7]